MGRPRLGLADDSGESLIELLVAIMLIGTAVVAILGGLGTSILVSGIHRTQAVAAVRLSAFAEALRAKVAASPSSYRDCAVAADYASVYTMADPRFTAAVTEVRYWNGTTFAATCTTDSGVQRVGLLVHSVDGRVDESVTVVIRKPCRSTIDFPADPACV